MDIIIGAGLTGLSLANQLKNCIVLEKTSKPGGTASSFDVQGKLFDYGIHVLNTLHPLIKTPLWEVKRIAKIGNLYYPYQTNPGKINNELKSEPANYYDYLLLKYGKDALEFHIPYGEKFWGVDLHTMDWKWADKYTPQGNGVNEYFYYPKEGGIGQIAIDIYNKLKKRRDVGFFFDATVYHIDETNHVIHTSIGNFTYDKLYSTIPIPEIHTSYLPAEVKKAIGRLRWTSIELIYRYIPKRDCSNDKYHWNYFNDEDFEIRESIPRNWRGNNSSLSQVEMSTTYEGKNIIKYAYCIPTLMLENDLRIINEYFNKYNMYLRGRYGRWKNLWMHESLNEKL